MAITGENETCRCGRIGYHDCIYETKPDTHEFKEVQDTVESLRRDLKDVQKSVEAVYRSWSNHHAVELEVVVTCRCGHISHGIIAYNSHVKDEVDG